MLKPNLSQSVQSPNNPGGAPIDSPGQPDSPLSKTVERSSATGSPMQSAPKTPETPRTAIAGVLSNVLYDLQQLVKAEPAERSCQEVMSQSPQFNRELYRRLCQMHEQEMNYEARQPAPSPKTPPPPFLVNWSDSPQERKQRNLLLQAIIGGENTTPNSKDTAKAQLSALKARMLTDRNPQYILNTPSAEEHSEQASQSSEEEDLPQTKRKLSMREDEAPEVLEEEEEVIIEAPIKRAKQSSSAKALSPSDPVQSRTLIPANAPPLARSALQSASASNSEERYDAREQIEEAIASYFELLATEKATQEMALPYVKRIAQEKTPSKRKLSVIEDHDAKRAIMHQADEVIKMVGVHATNEHTHSSQLHLTLSPFIKSLLAYKESEAKGIEFLGQVIESIKDCRMQTQKSEYGELCHMMAISLYRSGKCHGVLKYLKKSSEAFGELVNERFNRARKTPEVQHQLNMDPNNIRLSQAYLLGAYIYVAQGNLGHAREYANTAIKQFTEVNPLPQDPSGMGLLPVGARNVHYEWSARIINQLDGLEEGELLAPVEYVEKICPGYYFGRV